MSTKINVRSPFYLEFTEPVQTLGTFDCTTANLQNFAVQSDGAVIEPTIAYGLIIDETATSFAANTSGSPISRSITYTIEIPEGYSNVADSTVDCTVTVDQPSQTAQEDPVQNNNCPTFSGSIPSYSNVSSGTVINLASYFTAGAGASIDSYEIIRYGAAGIGYELTGSSLKLISSVNCASATFVVVAHNSADACSVRSNGFNASSNCVEDDGAGGTQPVLFGCGTVSLSGGSIKQDGQHTKASFKLGSVKELLYNGSVLSPPYNVGVNNSGGNLSKTITYRMYILPGYDNYTPGATIDCDVTYSQPAVPTLKPFECGDAGLAYMFISKKGNIAEGSAAEGTIKSWTPQSFPEVSVDTSRTVTFTVTAPNDPKYSNANQDIDCDKVLVQPRTVDQCGNTVLYLSGQGFSNFTGFCGRVFAAIVPAKTTASSYQNIISSLGQRICYNGTLFKGGNKYWAISPYSNPSAGGSVGSSFYTLQITDFGIVQDIALVNCSGRGEGDGFSL